jgi:L-iditol 2-dehydrogenase
MNMMAAVLFEGPEKLQVATLPRPECGPDEAILQVAACGICGGDVRSYFLGDNFTGKSCIPGHEAVGIASDVGQNVTRWKVGDRIALGADVRCGDCYYCHRDLFNMCDNLKILGKHMNGALTDYMLLTSEILNHGIIHEVPPNLKTLHAALSEPLCSVLASHDELNIGKGETVVVLGCGPMGILHFELLRARQVRVVLVDVSEVRLDRARRDFGAELTICSVGTHVTDRVLALTDGVGADVVISAAPSGAAVRQAIELARKRGRIGVFGGLPAAQAEVSIDVNRVHYRELRVIGNFSYHPSYHERALQMLAGGTIRCEALITQYRIEDTEQGLLDIRDGKVLKAVVVPNDGTLI